MSLRTDIGLQRGELGLDLSLSVAAGEVVALLGPNGAGKSSVLRALAGLLALEHGRLTLDGIDLDSPADGIFVPAERRPIGVMFQDHLLFPQLSVRENIAFGPRAQRPFRRPSRRTTRRDAAEPADEWMARMGLADLAHQRPDTLSGGQAQRVALARALARSPRLLLLDEPLSALDAGTRVAIRRELRRHIDDFGGMTVLVTHDLLDAHALADRLAIIEGGRLVQTGTLTEVTARPRSRYIADLVGVNLVRGNVVGDRLVTSDGVEIAIRTSEPGPSVAIIRPRSITLTRERPTATSARNCWEGSVVDIERLGDRIRVGTEGALDLTAEITAASLDDLDLRPGDRVHASVKASEVEVAPA